MFLFFPYQRSGLHRPSIRRHIVIDTPKDEVVAAPSQAAAPTFVIKPPSMVSLPFQAVTPPCCWSSSS
jgi:hypothetical protein